MCVCAFVCLFASYCFCLQVSAYNHIGVSWCVNVSACFIQCPCIGRHILMISPWSNYSAACITLSMWHTISRQLTWASECQPIGCATSPVSDIFISIVHSDIVITLKHQGEEIKKNLPVSVSLDMDSCGIVFFCFWYIFVATSIYTFVSDCLAYQHEPMVFLLRVCYI